MGGVRRDLDPAIRYHVESIEHTIEVLDVTEEWPGEDEDGLLVYRELDAYIAADVRIPDPNRGGLCPTY